MNKPIPAIDENGEFVVATQRNGEQVIIYTLHSDADQIVGECRWWHLDGSSICRSKPGYDLEKVRATVERAAKMRAEIAHRAAGSVSFEARVGRPSFAEALQAEASDAGDFRLTHMIERARRASEG